MISVKKRYFLWQVKWWIDDVGSWVFLEVTLSFSLDFEVDLFYWVLFWGFPGVIVILWEFLGVDYDWYLPVEW